MRRFLIMLLFGLSFGVFAGCEQEGPMERAGEEADQAVEDVGEAVEDTTDR